ncbi:MAG: TonB-dependent receptor [Methylotenera sp.]|nr:TonB-dependent receptor [Methylotenera sp.]
MTNTKTFNINLLSVAVIGTFSFSNNLAAEEVSERINTAPIVVTATRVEQNSFDLPVSIDAITSEIIHDAKQQVNLTETAARIPGIVVANKFNLAQDLGISTRGFGARSAFGVRGVRLYADGIPLSMPDGQGQTGTFNLDTAKQIEFMRGPFSALYGNSSGGVVQIFTRDGAKEPTISGGVTFGSYNTNRESLTFEGQEGNLNFILNGSHLTTDGYRDHSEATRDMLHTKLSYKAGDATKVTLVATALNQHDSQDPLALTPAQYKADPQQAGTKAISTDARAYKKQTQVGLTIDHNISNQQSISLMGYYGTRSSDGYLAIGAGNTGGRLSAIDRRFGGVDAKWTYKDTLAGKPYSIVAGLNYDNMKDERTQLNTTNGVVSSGLNRNENQTVYNLDQYIQTTLEPTDRWLLVAGLRHTKIKFEVDDKMPIIAGTDPDSSGSLDYSNTSPVLGATFKLTPTVNLYANYGKGFETPTFIEMTYVGNPSTGKGPNLGLKPSKSKNYEIGAKAFINDNTRVNAALFKVDTEKEIVVDQGQGTTASFKNAGDTERHGLELSIDSVLPNNFGFYAAYTLMNAEFKDKFCTSTSCTTATTVNSGNKIPGTYTSNTYAEVTWKHPASGFSTAIEGIYFSDAYTNDINTIKADAYAVFNLRGGFVQNLENWRLSEFVRIDNLTDKTYVSSVRVNTSAAYDPGAPRNWTVGLNASYKF